MRSLISFALGLTLCACDGKTTDSKTAPVAPPTSEWRTITVEWSVGPCAPDGRSCHQVLRVDPSGRTVTEETPNPPGGGPAVPLVKSSALYPDEDTRLEALIASPSFRKGMADGFPCAESQDARIVVTLETLRTKQSREVMTCVRSDGTNAAKTLVELLQRFRYASQL